MTKARLIFLTVFLFGSLTCQAQTIQYYWENQNKVYLWLTPDSDIITADYNQSDSKWIYAPEETDETKRKVVNDKWREMLKKLAGKYQPTADLAKCTDDELWQFALTYLRNEIGEAPLEKRQLPEVEIYIQKKNEKTVETAFLWRGNPNADPKYNYTFTKAANEVWKKDGTITLALQIGVNEDSEELRKIFNIDTPDLPKGADAWNAVWDKWIKKYIDDNIAATNLIAYTDKNGDSRLLLIKKLESNVQLPVKLSTPPQKPEGKLPVVNLPSQGTGIIPIGDCDGREYLYCYFPYLDSVAKVVGTIFIIGFLLWFIRNSEKEFVIRLRGKFAKFILNEASEKTAISFDQLDTLNDLAKHRLEIGAGVNESLKPNLSALLDWANQEYKAVAGSKQISEKSDEIKENIINEYLKNLDVEPRERGKVQNWLKLGRASEKIFEEIVTAKSLPFVKPFIDEHFGRKHPTDAEWFAQMPGLIKFLNTKLINKQKVYEKLLGESTEEKTKNIQNIKDKETEIKQQYEGEITRLKENEATANIKLSELNQNLSDANKAINAYKTENINLQASYDNTIKQNQDGKERLEKLEQKAALIKEVKIFSIYLRQWMQGYLDSSQNDMTSTALVEALVNHSLYQMCFSIMEDQPLLKKATAHNLFKCASLFNASQSHKAGIAQLEKIEQEAKTAFNNVSNNELGVETYDHRLFQAFLTQFKTDKRLDISPFFIDITGTRINRVNAS